MKAAQVVWTVPLEASLLLLGFATYLFRAYGQYADRGALPSSFGPLILLYGTALLFGVACYFFATNSEGKICLPLTLLAIPLMISGA